MEQVLEPHELEARATKVLESVPEFIWDGESLPVPVEDIVDSVYGLLVRDVDDMTEAPVPGGITGGWITGGWISGLLLPAQGEIWVNAEDARRWPPRRRFTICHELGHWELHRTGQQTLFCRAGGLLMPAHLLGPQWDECGGDVAELCRRFGCSEKAMMRRLAYL
jgi:hypothetical protein